MRYQYESMHRRKNSTFSFPGSFFFQVAASSLFNDYIISTEKCTHFNRLADIRTRISFPGTLFFQVAAFSLFNDYTISIEECTHFNCLADIRTENSYTLFHPPLTRTTIIVGNNSILRQSPTRRSRGHTYRILIQTHCFILLWRG